MKKNRIFSLLAISALLLSGCNNKEEQVSTPNGTLGDPYSVTFSIGLPAGDPVTYAQIQESDEYAINNLDIFEFNQDGKLVKVFKDVATTAAPDGDYVARKTVAKIQLDRDKTGTHDFLFVTNLRSTPEVTRMQEDLTALAANGTITKNVFKAKLTKALASQNADIRPPFIMTGNKEVTITNTGEPIDLSTQIADIVMLTRNVARLDIAQRLATEEESLVIKKVEVKDAPSLTQLFPVVDQMTAGAHLSPAADNSSVNYIVKSENDLTSYFDNVKTANYNSRYKKLFYLYERALRQFTEKGTPTVYITADYKPTPSAQAVKVRYKIPFDRDIKRNYLYTIVIGVAPNGDKYEGTVENLMVLKWEDEHKIAQPIKQLLTFTPAASQGLTFNQQNHEATLADGSAKTLTNVFTVTSAYADDENPTLVLVKENPTSILHPHNSWISATMTAGKVTIKVEENDEVGSRSGIIWFRSAKDVQGQYLYWMKITQPKKS